MLTSRYGWGETIVDALSTLLVAGLEDEFLLALNHTVHIDFTESNGLVNPFETIIRYAISNVTFPYYSYVGSIVSTIDLLEFFPNAPKVEPDLIQKLRRQAEVLVHKLSPGFGLVLAESEARLDSPTRMWFPRVDFQSSRGVSQQIWGETEILLAETGTNFLEYGRLSELCLDEQYVNNVYPSETALISRQRRPGGRLFGLKWNPGFPG